MKIRISELDGAALDWAVAKCEGNTFAGDYPHLLQSGFRPPMYSCYWEKAGPIIEREWLDITPWPNESDEDLRWQCHQHDNIDCVAFGPTPLIAAMRCYVASKLGDEIDIPE